MTPALLASFRAPGTPTAPGAPPLPVTWRERELFSRDHVDMLLDSLNAGVTLADSLRSALGATMLREGRRVHDATDARAALTAACTACRELERAVDAAIAEGRAAGRAAAAMVGTIKVEEKVTPKAHARPVETLDRFAEAKAASAAREAAERPAEQPPPARVRKFAPADEDGKVTSAAWGTIRAEAADRFGPGLAGLYRWQDEQLVRADFPPTSAYWTWSLDRFFAAVEQENKRWGVWLAGRGMGKSTTLTRVAALGGLWMPRKVHPHQRWEWPFISVRPTDADKRIEEIQGIIHDAYGIDVDRGAPRGIPTLTLDDALGNPIAYRSLASTIGNVKGPSCIGMILDEEAAMRAAGANPSGEIIASVIAAFRARDGIFAIRCSSAWERAGSHWNAVERGDTEINFVATLGPFVGVARAGFIEVASWEDARGNQDFAAECRRIAGELTAESKGIPTWVGHEAITAVKSRHDIEALDDETLGVLYPGLTRSGAWLREYGSVPLAPGGALRHPDSMASTVFRREAVAWI